MKQKSAYMLPAWVWTSGGNLVLKILIAAVAVLFIFVTMFVAGIIILPFALIAGAILLYIRHSNIQKLKALPDIEMPMASASGHPSPEQFSPDIGNRKLLNEAEEKTGRYSCQSLADTFEKVAVSLYEQESFHTPPLPPDTKDPIILARYQDQLAGWYKKIEDPESYKVFSQGLLDAYMTLRQYLPALVLQDDTKPRNAPLTVPLKPTLETEEAEAVAARFFTEEVRERGLFSAVRNQIAANSAELRESKAKPTFDTLFADTPFSRFTSTSVPLQLFDETRFAGMWTIAPQGMGKTTLLHSMILEDIPKDASIILMDSKGDLIEPFLEHEAIAHRRVIIGPDHPIGMNPLDIPRSDINKAVDNLEYLFASLLDFKLTAAQSMLLKAVLRSLITVFPNPTLGTFQDIMSDGPKKYAEHIKNLEPDLQNFFRNEFFTENIKARRQEVLQRLRLLLDHELLRSMLLSSSTTFRLGEAMDKGAFVIINNSRGRLGNKGAEFFGRFFIAQVLAAAQQRSFRKEKDKKPVYFYIDECHTVIAQDERITDILHECRSQKIGLILAHQETTQVSEKVLSALQNCAIRFAHPDEEARKLASSLRMDAASLQNMHRGQFAAFVRGLSKTGLVVNVSKPDFSTLKAQERPEPLAIIAQPPKPGSQEPIVNFNPRPPEMEAWRLDSADTPRQSQEAFDNAIRKRFSELPEVVQRYIQSDETNNRIRALATEANFSADQLEAFENEVMLALLRFQPVECLKDNIKGETAVSEEVAERLTADLLDGVFEPLAKALSESNGGHPAPAESPTAKGAEGDTTQDPGEPADKW